MKFFYFPFVLTILLVFNFYPSSAQLYINEFMASNTGAVVDPDYDVSADWIEIYNAGTASVQLNGYYLTDNLDNKTKWQITSDITILAGHYLVFWADTMNTGMHTNFKLSASGEEIGLISPQQVVIDSVVFGQQEGDISMGRKSDGGIDWVYFTTSTPGATNNTTNYSGIVKNEPTFSEEGGIFNQSVSLMLKSLYGGVVRYTLDGSEPSEQSAIAGSSITITKNTVIRARIYKTGEVPGPIVTNSYFIDLNNELSDLPIVSLATDPDNFWGADSGIYVMRSFKPEWEVPVNIELFEKDGRDKAAFNLLAGTKVNGLYSWQLPQKMLGIYFKKDYGVSKLEYPLFFDKSRKVFDDFALRASGNDWSNTLFRDGLVQTSIMDYIDLDMLGFRACVVYINGEFLGIHNIREKYDEDYIIGNRGLEKGTFDLVGETDTLPWAEAGDLVAYQNMKTLTSKDLTIQANWDSVEAIMDIDNFTDMIATEIYDGNFSIDHNVMAWKPKDSGKWKWVLMDLDRGFYKDESISFYIKQTAWPFQNLMENTTYVKTFGKRLADLLYTCFNPDRMVARIEAHQEAIAADIPAHIARWEGTSSSYGDPISSVEYWNSEVEELKTYAKARPATVLSDLKKNYGFGAPVTVIVKTVPSNAGILTFNGLKIPVDSCNGGYPKGEEIKLVAKANAGYQFIGWKTTGSNQYLTTDIEYDVTPEAALNISAVFESDGKCILPSEITTDLTLNKECSPYVASSDVNITSTGKLTIPAGIEIWMSDSASIYSEGVINALGTADEPVIFRGNPERTNKEWGFISVSDVSDTCRFVHVIVKNASRGARPREVGAITAYNSVVKFDSIYFDSISANPIATRFCKVTLSNSQLHSNIVGDLINITRGTGYISNCDFVGNSLSDNDAIDFNGGSNSIVKNCIVRDFLGINSDAIDLGEKATNITIDGLYVHDITDKGVSVGQWSTATIKNSLFTNCNLGAGVKDSSFATIDHCTFYGVGIPVATYEKIVGRGGGNVKVINSILSNAYDSTYLCDQYSTIDISYSSSDNTELPDGEHNIFNNPDFENPTCFDFSLLSGSPCIGTAQDGDMGSGLTDTGIVPEVLISKIAYFTETGAEDLEFIALYNPGSSRVDLSGYSFKKGITYTFPDGISIGPGETFYVTSNSSSSFWDGRDAPLFQWESGRLADEGEDIQLANEVGTMIDEVAYNNKSPWPVPTKATEAIALIRFDVDNHFGEYWQLETTDETVSSKTIASGSSFCIYPNPSTGLVTITGLDEKIANINVYNLQGSLVGTGTVSQDQHTIDLSGLTDGFYFICAGSHQGKLIIRK